MNTPDRAHLFVSANTHPGMKGKNNEDRYAVSTHRMGREKKTPSLLAVVCDGIGGHRAGEVAAEIGVETISKIVAQDDGQQPLPVLTHAIQEASTLIQEQSESEPDRRGMGATCVCAWIIEDRLFTASVGDSRLYLVRDNQIQQVTTDHTWVQEAIEFGALTPDQARGHPNAHVIRRYLGSKVPPEPDFRLRLHPEESDETARANQGTKVLPGDFLLLCSDGLTDLVDPDEIMGALKSQEREGALQSLIDLANERGGHDNITVVVVEAPEGFSGKAPKKEGEKKSNVNRNLVLGGLLISLAVIVVALGAGGLFWYFNLRIDPTPTFTSRPTDLPAPVVPAADVSATPTEELLPPILTSTVTMTAPAVEQGTPAPTYTPWRISTLTPSLTPTLTQTLESGTETPTPSPSQ